MHKLTLRFCRTGRTLLAGALATCCLLGATEAASPDTVVLNINEAPAPPDKRFMDARSINPSDIELKGGRPATPPVAAPDLGAFVVGQAAPSYRTLTEAAKAGVNPLDPPKLAAARSAASPAKDPAVPDKGGFTYLLGGFSAFIVGFIFYAVFSARVRKNLGKA